jgi:glycosidase
MSRLTLITTALILAGGGCAGSYDVDEPTTAIMNGGDWRDEVIYQIMVDRFADGDLNNDYDVVPNSLGRYQGGDWQGVIDHLDYLNTLGVTTLWISPIVKNIESDAGFDGYHGYWSQDYNSINPHFGSPDTLRQLVDKAHGLGMKVILDIVCNHVGQIFYYDVNGNGEPDDLISGSTSNNNADPMAQLMQTDEYDPDFNINGVQGQNGDGPSGPAQIEFLYEPETNHMMPPPIPFGSDPTDVLDFSIPGVYNLRGEITNYDVWEQLTTGDFPGGLKDLDTRRHDVRRGLITAYARFIRQYDFDGLRIDTIKHVEHEFWQEFSPAIRGYVQGQAPLYNVPPLTVPKQNFFMFGEAFDGDDSLLGEFTYNNEMDSVFYFSQKFDVYSDVVKCGAPTQNVEQLWNNRLQFNPPDAQVHQQLRDSEFTDINGDRLPDPVAGQPIYNLGQQGVALGPVDSSGQPIPPAKLLVNFLDNHDVPRYLSPIDGCYNSAQDAMRVLHNAQALQFTQDGIPCIYYGTEQGFDGGNDPANRERLFDLILDNVYNGASTAERENLSVSGYSTTTEDFQWLAHLIKVRKAYDTLRRGDLRVTWSTAHTSNESDSGILAFVRTYQGKIALIVTNVNDSQTSETAYDGGQMSVPFPSNTQLVEVLGDPYDTTNETTYLVPPTGTLDVHVSSRATKILVPASDRVN